MTEPNIVNLLIQIPFVAAFIWYSLQMSSKLTKSNDSFLDALAKRDEAFEKRNKEVIDAIADLNKTICIQFETQSKIMRQLVNRQNKKPREIERT